jgi:hypothetical protein
MLCAFVTAIVGSVGVLKVREVATMQTEMYEREFVPVRADGTAAWQAASHFRRLYSYILNPDVAGRADTVRFNHGGEAAILAAFEYERKHASTDAQKQLLSDFDLTWPAYMSSVAKVMALADQNDQPGALVGRTRRVGAAARRRRCRRGPFRDVVARELRACRYCDRARSGAAGDARGRAADRRRTGRGREGRRADRRRRSEPAPAHRPR